METQPAVASELLLHDDFSGPFPGQWRIRPVPGLPAGDGVPATGPDGLTVVPTGRDPVTGQAAFVEPDRPLTEADHLRWAILADRQTPEGVPGFSLEGGRLTLSAALSVQAYGLDRHPYADVDEPHRDIRLGSAALILMDRKSGVVFDFITTDRCVFAVYERLAFPGTAHAGFSYAIPVADREPMDVNRLTITYDAADGTARWHAGDTEVLAVSETGRRLPDDRHLMRDNGRPDETVIPRQLTCGLALFATRLWGQGVRLAVREVELTRTPGGRRGTSPPSSTAGSTPPRRRADL
jgi:hypothetical protein